MTEIDELQQNIKKSQEALVVVASRRNMSWISLAISLALLAWVAFKIPNGSMYLLVAGLCVLYIALNAWRIFRFGQVKKERQAELERYQSRLSELQAQPAYSDQAFSEQPEASN